MEKMGAEVYHHMWGPSEFTMTGTLMHTDLTNQLSQLSVPTLLTAGEFDEATPTTTQFYQSKISGAEIHIFPGASHSHHLESETEYLQVVKTFLGKHP